MSTLLIALSFLQLSCPGPNCPRVPGAVEWKHRDDDPGRAYLFVQGKQAGGYDRERDEWRDYDPAAATWGTPRPLFPRRTSTGALNFGIVRERLMNDVEEHSLSGRAVTAVEARAAFGGLSDDSDKLRLTIIGTSDQRQMVRRDLDAHPKLSALRDRLLVQDYPPDHWAVADAGFVRTGQPTIYVQSSDGRVQHRQDDYRGPEKLAEAIRRADPRYRPDLDPDLNSRLIFPGLRIPRMPAWAWVAVAVLLLVALSKRRNLP